MNRYHDSLRSHKVNYIIVAALFLIFATICAFQARERKLLEKRRTELLRATEGLSRIQASIQERRNALDSLRSQFASQAARSSAASQIYGRLDEIVATYKPDSVTFGTIDKNGDSASMKYTLTFRNVDYNVLLNIISRLQRNIFPFSPVESVSVSLKEIPVPPSIISVIEGRIVSMEGTGQ